MGSTRRCTGIALKISSAWCSSSRAALPLRQADEACSSVSPRARASACVMQQLTERHMCSHALHVIRPRRPPRPVHGYRYRVLDLVQSAATGTGASASAGVPGLRSFADDPTLRYVPVLAQGTIELEKMTDTGHKALCPVSLPRTRAYYGRVPGILWG